jgi:hypothetical protein
VSDVVGGRVRSDVASEGVTFGASVPGTIAKPARPATPGRYPGIVLLAGSGPTDRNWDSPLLAGSSPGQQLAEALAAHGVVVLRFDKASVGGNHTPITDGATIDVYRDEGRAALALLRVRPDVDPTHLYVAGHSEGHRGGDLASGNRPLTR